MARVFLFAARRLSLVTASWGFSLGFLAVLGLLIAVTSLVAEHRLWGSQASVVSTHRLSSM